MLPFVRVLIWVEKAEFPFFASLVSFSRLKNAFVSNRYCFGILSFSLNIPGDMQMTELLLNTPQEHIQIFPDP